MQSSTQGLTIFLLDAMALAYRAHFSFLSRPRINSRGENTSALYGFTTTLINLIEEVGLKHAAVVFDGPGKTFRNDLYPDYKANRDAPPDALIENLPRIKELAHALSIPVLQADTFEADDIIGTLARQADASGAHAVIVSPDKDFQQLLSPRIEMLRPRHGAGFERLTEGIFREKYQIPPHNFIDMLALMGDSSDNVPGARGIGEKGAAKLVQQDQTIENILSKAATYTSKRWRTALTENPDMVRLSKDLVTIRTDLNIDLDWNACRVRSPRAAESFTFYRRYEFSTLIRRLSKGAELFETEEIATESTLKSYQSGQANYRMITTIGELKTFEQSLKETHRVGLSTIMTSGSPVRADWLGLAISWDSGSAVYVPLPLQDGTSEQEVIRVLAPVFSNGKVEKIGHDLKPLLVRLRQYSVPVRGKLFDTQIAHYLLSPDQNHRFGTVTKQQLNYEPQEMEDILGTGRLQKEPRSIVPEKFRVLACERAACPLAMQGRLRDKLKENSLLQVADEIEFPLVYVLADMEATGVQLNRSVLDELGPKIQRNLDQYASEIYEEAGESFNIASSKQVGEILFGKLGYPVKQKTPSGKPSTKEEVLLDLATEYKVAALIIDWRKAAKLKGTYVDSLARMIVSNTSRVHTIFHQTSAATGRLSSTDPALQNIPVRDETGRYLRCAFIAPEGWYILSADYSQIELRILAHMSGDQGLREFFATGRDPHTETAARIYKVDASEITREQRNKAKAVNYGIPYGLSPSGLSRGLRCTRKEAQQLMNAHQESFPGIWRFMQSQVELAKEHGFAATLKGRRRYLPDLKARNGAVRAAAERIAVNMPIQGTQADMIKLAAIAIDRKLQQAGMRSKAILQVHDELVFEVPKEELAEAGELVRACMTQAMRLDVPIEVNLGSGINWLQAH
ncbi:MAG: DNA polymerase I [Bacteroidetes bacterium]|nr:DNA polymerase I [Bacteroidota bacterium]